ALVRDVIRRHGGSVSASSEDEQGLTFSVALPRTATAGMLNGTGPDDGVTLRAHSGVSPAHCPIDGVRVLLVDDEPDAREALVGILTHYGAVVHAAGSAADAVSALNREPIDVLLADIGMPGEDGYDLIRSVRLL